jgi:pimeloyl-ACP methyl ester carboxylesterase
VVALAPAGGWAAGSGALTQILGFQGNLHQAVQAAAPYAEQLVASPQGRRNATQMVTVNYEHIPAELLAHQIRGLAAADAPAMLQLAATEGYDLEAERIDCPVRIVWGREDRLLALPGAAERFRREWLPTADWVELDDVGHAPQLDVPLETAQLILDFVRSRG